jgi:quercetin dioxygenase-like cupin family protein
MSEERASAVSTVLIDNARMRVIEWRFPPGGATGWHRHGLAYCVVPMTTGQLLIEGKESSEFVNLETGKPYTREAGVEHDVINPNPFEFVFLEIEVK